jgi:glycosyltransferase involved in cell wall biosynthesis
MTMTSPVPDDRRASRATVCIATCMRPDGLERLLESLAGQNDAPDFDVVVVDNDAEGSAAPVAARFGARLRLEYQLEPERGLAAVRNRAVAAATGEYLAFIDDDEWATPLWLAGLDRKARATGADAVIGPVRVLFDDTVAAEVRTCGLFDIMPLDDGADVPWWFTRTSNAYVRRASLPHHEGPFARDFDLTGGEDVELFWRMLKAGARVVACADAVVFEHRPLSRANRRWVLRRAARDGHNKAHLEWSDRSTSELWTLGLCSAGGVLWETLAAAGRWPSSREDALRHALLGAGEVGKLAYLAGVKINEYRRRP